MFPKNLFALLLLHCLLVSGNAAASMIGDEVTCFYDVDVGAAFFNGSCSTEYAPYTPGPAIVNDNGPSDPEFYLGADIFGPGSFLVGIEIDIGADYFILSPTATMIGTSGDLFIELGSLNWMDNPDSIIVGTTLSGTGLETGTLDLSHTDDSVALEFTNFFVAGNTSIRVDLTTGPSIPVPASAALLLLGLSLINPSRKLFRNK